MNEDLFAGLLRAEAMSAWERIVAEFEGWRVAGTQRPVQRLDEARCRAICSVMEGFLARRATLQDDPRKLDAARLQTEQAWALFRHLLVQREDLHNGELLQRADACATAGYLSFARGLAPPIVVAEPIDSPVTYQRNVDLFAPALAATAAQSVPIPIVIVPPSYLRCPWLLTTMHHEVGHNLFRDLGLSGALPDRISARLQQAGVSSDEQELWCRWLDETVADAFGVLLSGRGFAWSLALVFDRLSQWPTWNDGGKHPPPALRLAVIEAMLARRYPGRAADEVLQRHVQLVAATVQPNVEPMRPSIELVVSAIFDHPLDGKTLLQAAPPVAEDDAAVAAMIEHLRGGAADAAFPLRLVPAAAQLALAGGLPIDQVRERSLQLLRELPGPEWTPSITQWEDLRNYTLKLVPPILSGTVQRLKIPPAELLLRHEEISFVGANHPRLPLSLAKAFRRRRRRRWGSIEVFFLEEPALRQMKSASDPVHLRERSLRRLRRLLPHYAESWRIYSYPFPYYFASYWDVGTPAGRIHISPYIWAEDVATCPATDYLRGDGAPSPQYASYLRGLAALRELAVTLCAG